MKTLIAILLLSVCVFSSAAVSTCRGKNISKKLVMHVAKTSHEKDYGKTMSFERTSYFAQKKPVWTGKDLTEISFDDSKGDPLVVNLELNKAAAEKWSEATGTHIGDVALLAYDDQVLIAPVIKAKVEGNSMMVELREHGPLGKAKEAMTKFCAKFEPAAK